jgi:hypothetical protein
LSSALQWNPDHNCKEGCMQCNAATACRSATVLREPEADAVCNALNAQRHDPRHLSTLQVHLHLNRITPAGHKIAKVLSRMKFVPRHMMGNQLQWDRLEIIRNKKGMHRCLRVLGRFIRSEEPPRPRVPQLCSAFRRSAPTRFRGLGFGGGVSRLLENEAARF